MKEFMSRTGNKSKIIRIAAIMAVAATVIVLILIAKNFIYYYGLNKKVYIEVGEDVPYAKAFLKNGGDIKYISDVTEIDTYKLGKNKITINFNGKEKVVYLVVRDTKPPVAEGVSVDVSIYDELEAKELIKNVKDSTKVKVRYKTKPKFGEVGKYEAVIELKDEGGNKTEIVSTVNVLRVKEYVEYTIGDKYPDVEEFIFSDRDSGEFVTNLSALADKAGTYYVTILIDGKKYTSKIIFVDDKAPAVVGKDAELSVYEVKNGVTVSPGDFVYEFFDNDDVNMVFVDKPDYTLTGEQSVSVAVTDASGNTTIIERKFYIEETKGFEVEIGSGDITDNIVTANLECTRATIVKSEVNTSKLGRYKLVANIDGVEKELYVRVVDRDCPEFEVSDITLDTKQEITPELFVKNVKDSTRVTMSFINEIDKQNKGLQKVKIMLEDEGGNVAYAKANLNILYDALSPEIAGVSDITTFIRQTPDYLLGVKAIDETDGDVTVSVDTSKVNLEQAGLYEIMYTAVDKSGNKATVKSTLEVKNVTRELLDSMADDILAEITTESMTKKEKAEAIFDYVQSHVRYISSADQSSTEKAAYDGLTLGVGDCYTYASLMEIFIERIGGEMVFVRRDNPTRNHYWHLCNLGDGWYHMDATPYGTGFKCFMKTDAQINEVSTTYWVYDKTLYPAVETKIYE